MSRELQPGTTFAGRYEVCRCIGRGGMGAVYEVVHRETQRRRALKVLLPSLVSDPEARARFAQEASITAEIESEHLVEIYDAGVDEGSGAPYIVMELLRGESFGERLARGQRHSPSDVVEVLAQVALTLEQTHRYGIVHRDLKPDNLFLCRRDDGLVRVKILDFGIAKVVARAAAVARSTANIGTPLYMAPEQLDGSAIGPATDLFALTHIAFELLTGESYWEAEIRAAPSTMVLLKWMERGLPEPASARAARLGVQVAGGFDAWFERGVAPRPEQRFRTSIELVDAFAEAVGARRAGPAQSRGSLAEVLTFSQRGPASAPQPEPALGTYGGTTLPRAPVGARRSQGAMVTPVEPRGTSRLALAVGAGVGAALVIGAVALLALRGPRATAQGERPAEEPAPSAASGPPAPAIAATSASASAASSAAGAAAPPPSAASAARSAATSRPSLRGVPRPTATTDCRQAAWRCRKP